eukprot:m.134359 g.134359  ORF g.134359 m.134359 type:complete len:64 (+) comp13113_c2_seq1:1255-1446(+)
MAHPQPLLLNHTHKPGVYMWVRMSVSMCMRVCMYCSCYKYPLIVRKKGSRSSCISDVMIDVLS